MITVMRAFTNTAVTPPDLSVITCFEVPITDHDESSAQPLKTVA